MLGLTNVKILEIDKQFSHVSSTAIRQAVNDGKPIKNVETKVASFIQKRGFFKGGYKAADYQAQEAALVLQRTWRKKQEKQRKKDQPSNQPRGMST